MNSNEIDKGQALADDLANEVVDVEPYEYEPDFDRSQMVDDKQDDVEADNA